MRLRPRRLWIVMAFCLVCAGDALAQEQSPERIIVELQPDGSNRITVRRLKRTGQRNPPLTLNGQKVGVNKRDTVLFDSSCPGCAINFEQATRETPIFNLYPVEMPEVTYPDGHPDKITIIVREANMKNCQVPEWVIVEGGLHRQYTSYPTHIVNMTNSEGGKVFTRYMDIPDGDDIPTPVEYDMTCADLQYATTHQQLLNHLTVLVEATEYVPRVDLQQCYKDSDTLQKYVELLRVGRELERRIQQ